MAKERGFHVAQEADDTWGCDIVDSTPLDAIYALRTMLEVASQVIGDNMGGGNDEIKQTTEENLRSYRRTSLNQYKYFGENESIHLARYHIEGLHALLSVYLYRAEVESGGEVG